MSISSLLSDNSYHLFADRLSVRELIAKKISSATGGSFSIYDATVSYSIGDVVIYNGCFYTSLIDNNVGNTPAYDSPDWMKISNLKSTKNILVNNEIGSDAKAIDDCSSYPFRTLDAAIDYANLNNPSGSYSVILQKTGIPYQLSRDLTKQNVSIIALDGSLLLNGFYGDDTTVITIMNPINISGKGTSFRNLRFECVDPLIDHSFLITNSVLFSDCNFNKTNNTNGMFHITTSTDPNYLVSFLILDTCYRTSTASSKILISETSLVPFLTCNCFLLNCGTRGNTFSITESSDPLLSVGIMDIRCYNCPGIFYSGVNSSCTLSNCGLRFITSSSDSPKQLNIYNCSFLDTVSFNKTGSADFEITGTTLPSGYVLTSGAIKSIYQTTGPQNNYISTTTYNQNDIINYQGELYKCLVNSTTNITPAFNSPNWLLRNFSNKRIAVVNSENGDDTKALTENYPFLTLDAAIDSCNIIYPTGNYTIILQKTGINYSLSRNLTKDNVNIITLDPAEATNPTATVSVVVDVQNTIVITGHTFIEGINFKYDDVLSPSLMFQISSIAVFKSCVFQKTAAFFNEFTGSFLVTAAIDNTQCILILYACTRTGGESSSSTTTMGDQNGNKLARGSGITVLFSPDQAGFNIRDETTSAISNEELRIALLNNYTVGLQTHKNDNTVVRIVNCVMRTLISTANAPSTIYMINTSFFWYFNFTWSTLSKSGTANLHITNCDLPPSPLSLNPGTTYSVVRDGTSDYYAANTYNLNDLAFNDGQIWQCLNNNTLNVTPNETNFASWNGLTIKNQPTLWTTPPAVTNLTTGLTNTADKLNILTLSSDPFALLGNVTANSFRIIKSGVYQISFNTISQTTQTTGQDCLIDIFIGSSTVSDVASSYSVTNITRGLVQNTTTYPTNNQSLTLFLSIPNASPLLNTDISFYARTTSNQNFTIGLVKMFIMRLRTY